MPRDRSARTPAQMFYTLLLLLGVTWYAYMRVCVPLQSAPLTGAFHGNDFKHLYLGAWMIAHGENPYDSARLMQAGRMRGFQSMNPYVYLPFTGLAMAPLAALDPPDALLTWFVLNHLFLLGALALIFWSLEMRPVVRDIAFVALAAALCYPLNRTLTAGQLNCALLLLYAGVYALERRGRPALAGGVAAFAFLFKLAPGILFIYFAWRRAWKALAAMCAATALLLGLTFAWGAGLKTHLAFLPLLKDMGFGKSTWSAPELGGQHFFRDASNQSFNAFFHHAFARWDEETTPWVNLGPGAANALTWAALAACLALVFWRLEIGPRRGAERRTDGAGSRVDGALAFGLFVLLSLLAPSLYWDHYVVIALWAFIACYSRLRDEARHVALAWMLFGALAIWGLLEGPLVVAVWRRGGALVSGAGPVLFFMTLGLALIPAALGWALGTLRHAARPGYWPAMLLGAAGAMLLARFRFDADAFRSGAGLLAMSLKLWGTLLLFGVCLALVITKEETDGAGAEKDGSNGRDGNYESNGNDMKAGE